jgi:septal ring factor EnvC (AmiA/AmiB activator)
MNVRRPLVAILLPALFLVPAVAHPRQDVSEIEKRITQLNEQIKGLKTKIQEEDKKESTIISTLSRIGLTKKLIRSEMAANDALLEKTNGELKLLRKDMVRRKKALEEEEDSIEKILVTLFKFGRFDFLKFALKAENIELFFTESKHLTVLARTQETIISGYLAALAELGATEGRLEAKRKEIAGLILTSEAKKRELEVEEKKNRDLVAEVQRSRKSYEQALKELDESAEQLQILIKKIADQEYSLPFAFVPLYEKKGKLPWPIQGRIITSFGLRKHPRFNTITLNNGIEIAPKQEKAIIHSVHPGRIVYADVFEGYGNLIIIDHGMTYYSLYGHCSEFLVAKGDAVKAGQPIALVGDSGSLNGECLYFELRFKTRALDPLQWLKGR